MEGALFMHRFALFSLLLFSSTAVLCQSMATPPDNSRVPQKPSAAQWPLDFSSGQPVQPAVKPVLRSFDCNGPNTTPNQAGKPIDLDHLFDATCTDLKSQVETLKRGVELFARNENSFSRSPLVVRPHPKGEPIPTQFPNAKVERIPTEWPNLKLQLVDGDSPPPVPAHVSQK
jgi:hypothetical protein